MSDELQIVFVLLPSVNEPILNHRERITLHNPTFNPFEFEGVRKEADVLNVAMFGMTANQWREDNPDLKCNIREMREAVVEVKILNNIQS